MTDEQINHIWYTIPASDDLIAQVTAFARALLAAGASEGHEPVAIYHGNGIIDCGDAGHHNIELLKMIPAGAKLYKDPPAEIGVLREAMKGAEIIANAAGAEIAALREAAKGAAVIANNAGAEIKALRERLNAAASLNAVYADEIRALRERIAGMEKDAREILRLATCDAANSVNAPALLKKVAEIVAKEPK